MWLLEHKKHYEKEKKKVKNTNKKGFTIVELVIVIAVVAVLAAVLIPTFAGLIDKANISNDTILVKNINTALTAESVLEGDPKSIDEVLEYIAKSGYNVDKLTPTSTDSHIVYDAENNRFALIDKDKNVIYAENEKFTAKAINIWFLADEYGKFGAEYSYYLTKDYTFETETMTVTTETGDITADFVNITSGVSLKNVTTQYNIYFETTEEVTASFVMNGGMFVAKTPNGTIHSYGDKDKVVLLEVADESYHEYGRVKGNIIAQAGRVVIEKTAEASTILVTSKNVKIENYSKLPVTIAPTTEEAKAAMSTIVTTKGNATVQEEIVDTTKASLFAGGLGTKESPYLIATAEQFANINDDLIQNKIVFVNAEGKLALGGGKFYFKLINDIHLEGKLTGSRNFRGELDGDGYSIYTNGSIGYVFYTAFDSTFKNIKLIQSGENASSLVVYSGVVENPNTGGFAATGRTVFFENVDVYGETQDAMSFVGYRNSSYTVQTFCSLTYKDCDNHLNIFDTDSTAIFLGNYPDPKFVAIALTFDNCVNYGTVSAPSLGFFIGNSNGKNYNVVKSVPTNVTAGNVYLVINNCSNEGQLIATSYCGPINLLPAKNHDTEKYIALNNSILSEGVYSQGIVSLGSAIPDVCYNSSNELVITAPVEGTFDRYEITYYVAVGYSDGSSYFRVVIPCEKNETSGIKFVREIITDINYEAKTGNSYADINSDEQKDVYNRAYKIVELDGKYVAVVSVESLQPDFDAEFRSIDKIPTYIVSCISGDAYVGSKVYTANDIPVQIIE